MSKIIQKVYRVPESDFEGCGKTEVWQTEQLSGYPYPIMAQVRGDR